MSTTRRQFLAGATAAAAGGGLAACTTPTGSQIDARVRATRDRLFAAQPELAGLAERSAGVLIIPEIIEGSFVFGGTYGEGALMVGDAIVDYISVSSASVGFQGGVQSFGQALFFTTPEALAKFRTSDGWQLGVDAKATVLEDGVAATATTTTVNRPIYEVVFGQRGLLLGASLEGAKYNRLIR